MKIAVIDFQGFYIQNTFHPKEITIQIGLKTNHYLIKPPYPFHTLSVEDRKTVVFAEKYHGLKYTSGYTDYDQINGIIKDNLLDINIIYVRGNQKADYLLMKAWDLNLTATIVDIVKFDGDYSSCSRFMAPPPKIEATEKPYCLNHSIPAVCTLNNCQAISQWIYDILPI